MSEGKSSQITNIVINARQRGWSEKKISYEQLVDLAYPGQTPDQSNVFTITYAKGKDRKEGSLVAGETVNIKEGMIFNVTQTSRS